VTKGVEAETLYPKETPGAPGRTWTRDTQFRKPNSRDTDSPTKWANPKSRLTFCFFCVPTNLAQFVWICINYSHNILTRFFIRRFTFPIYKIPFIKYRHSKFNKFLTFAIISRKKLQKINVSHLYMFSLP